MGKNRSVEVRAKVAGNVATPITTLEVLARDDEVNVRCAVAGNPSSSSELLKAMIKNPYQTDTPLPHWFNVPQEYREAIAHGEINRPSRGDNAVWRVIAERDDLASEVISEFGQLSPRQASSFASQYLAHIRIVEHLHEVNRVNPRIFEALAAISDTREHKTIFPTFELQFALGAGSIQSVIASIGWAGKTPLNDETALIIANCDEVSAHQNLVATFGKFLPRDAALALSNSQDWKVLMALANCLSLNEEEKKPVLERLKAFPEWQELDEERRRNRQLSRILDRDGRFLQDAALHSKVFDSPVEEIFWEAYRKNPPPALAGLVAQHVVGKYRLDFALPDKKIGIELDGFSFHSSRDDLVRDRQRQRNLEQQGWRIVRFAAKEVFENPVGCVNQTADWVNSH